MTKSTVLDVMGTTSERGCASTADRCLFDPGAYVTTVTNPYRSESIRTADGSTAEVLFYYTDIKGTDGATTDDELTPLIFEEGRLVGWGWYYVEQNVDRYEIRVR